MTGRRPRLRVRLPPPDVLSTGAGVLLGAVLVAAPALAGLAGLDVPWSVSADDEINGIPIWPVLLVVGALLALVAIIDLAGRTELRQGAAIVGLGGAALAGLLVGITLRDGLQASVDDRDAALALLPVYLLALWGSALVVGTLTFGPTRTAVLIGLVTLALALLLPSAPDGRPFVTWYATAGPAGPILIAGMLIVGVWRLMDLPFVGGILLGGALLVYALSLAAGTTPPDEPAGQGMLGLDGLVTLVQASAIWVALGAIFGRPAPE